jgi:hypothetical protein
MSSGSEAGMTTGSTGTSGTGNTGTTGTSGSTSNSTSGTNQSGSTMGNTSNDAMPQHQGMTGMNDASGTGMVGQLNAATGDEFNRLWISQMFTMHEAKLAELQAAQTQLRDTELKALVTRTIPKIRMHRDMLQKMNTGTGSSTNTNQ